MQRPRSWLRQICSDKLLIFGRKQLKRPRNQRQLRNPGIAIQMPEPALSPGPARQPPARSHSPLQCSRRHLRLQRRPCIQSFRTFCCVDDGLAATRQSDGLANGNGDDGCGGSPQRRLPARRSKHRCHGCRRNGQQGHGRQLFQLSLQRRTCEHLGPRFRGWLGQCDVSVGDGDGASCTKFHGQLGQPVRAGGSHGLSYSKPQPRK